MKIHLAEIPDEGMRRTVSLPLKAMSRLIEVIGPQQGRLDADVWIRNHDGNVEIEGAVQVQMDPPCQRCLEPVPLTLDEPLLVALLPERAYDDAPEDTHLGAGDLEVSFYSGDELDLAQILEDELLLMLPEPVAEEDDEGRCTVCGRDVDALFPEDGVVEDDNPFARMKDLLHSE